MTKLSVNINKIATIRNARGGDIPNVVQAAINCEKFGAQGITVHPRPDQRHITYKDVVDLKKVVTTEFNIEGYPCDEFMKLVLDIKPHQVTLVPDPPEALTSSAGWDTIREKEYLKTIISQFKEAGIRTSIFVEGDVDMVRNAKDTGADRIEFYTKPYVDDYENDREKAIAPFVEAAIVANEVGLGINAGHDLNLVNLKFFAERIPNLAEVSIGHALISDALYMGLETTIGKYLDLLK